MNRTIRLTCFLCLGFSLSILLIFSTYTQAQSEIEITPLSKSLDLEISSVTVDYLAEMDCLVFEQQVDGIIGNTIPDTVGSLDGAPVLGYVFPTSLEPEDVGFSSTEGIVALAVTSHPDFDDTPLWDENLDGNYANDGVVFHPHWVVLGEDERVAGGLAVKEFQQGDTTVVLPTTNPGMTMYMDSPGFAIVTKQNSLKVIVPAQRIQNKTDFNYDAVAAYMQINTSDDNRPMLGVYEVYSVSSGDLSLPYAVRKQ